MADSTQKIGWIGMGRMGSAMAERLLKAGYDVSIWNRTRSKAEPLAAKGGKIVDKVSDLAGMDIVFSIVSTGPDLKEVYFGKDGLDHRPQRQAAEDLRRLLDHRGRGLRRDPRTAQGARRRIRGGADLRQRQGDQGRQAVGGAVGRGSGLPRPSRR